MASFWVKANGVAGGGVGVNKNTAGFTKWPQPQNYKYCLDWFQDDCYITSLFGVKKCQGEIKMFNSIIDPLSCPKQCNNGGGDVASSRAKNVLDTFIEKQSHSNMMNALINSPVYGWLQYTENIWFHKDLDIPWTPMGQVLGYVEAIFVGHYDNYKSFGPCWRIMIFGGKLGGDAISKTIIMRAKINMQFNEDRGWELNVSK